MKYYVRVPTSTTVSVYVDASNDEEAATKALEKTVRATQYFLCIDDDVALRVTPSLPPLESVSELLACDVCGVEGENTICNECETCGDGE